MVGQVIRQWTLSSFYLRDFKFVFRLKIFFKKWTPVKHRLQEQSSHLSLNFDLSQKFLANHIAQVGDFLRHWELCSCSLCQFW